MSICYEGLFAFWTIFDDAVVVVNLIIAGKNISA